MLFLMFFRQQEGQYTAMAALMKELEETQKNYGEEKEQLLQAKRESMVKQRLQHDLGGLTDTVVCGGGCGSGRSLFRLQKGEHG